MTISEKAAYLKGLMDGLKLDTEKAEGQMIEEIVNLLGDMAKRLTDDEIEQKVRSYLQTHGYIQRRDLESLCSLSISTAKRHLNRLCKAGVLVNRGMRNQPLYYLKEE